MTALSAERNTPKRGTGVLAEQYSLPVAATTKLYAGSIACINLAGYMVPGSATAGLRAVGRCEKTADNSAGNAGDINVEVRKGVFKFANSSSTDALTSADVKRECYIVDDQTVARTSAGGTRPLAGIVEQVDSDGVWVELGVLADRGPIDLLVVAGADLSLLQNTFVALNNAGAVVAASAAGQQCLGVLQNAPANGAVAIVRTRGLSAVIASAAINPGTDVATTNAGKSKAAVAASTNTSDAGAASDPLIGSFVMGYAVTVGANGVAHMIDIQRTGAIPTTAA